MTSAFSDLQLYPSERNKMKVAWAQLSKKYLTTSDSISNLGSFAREAEQRFAEIGFVVAVDFDPVQLQDGTIVTSPQISIVDRITPEPEHDHELHQQEIISGEEDGIAGIVDPTTGILKDASKSF